MLTFFLLRELRLERKSNVKIMVIVHEEIQFRIPIKNFNGSLRDREVVVNLGRQESERERDALCETPK